MTERIASYSPVPWTPAVPDEVGAAPDEVGADSEEDGGVCRDPAEPSTGPKPTNNNAQRTSARREDGAYADAGVTSSGDSVYAGAAALKTRDETGIEVEVFSGSAQAGAQSELQLGMARVGYSNANVSASGEVLTTRLQLGVHNDDGSTGFNAGALSTGAAAEVTYTTDAGSSFTAGAAVSLGASVSYGIRDANNDDGFVKCLKLSFGLLTGGFCVKD
jgi:hypothetical protein